jgi:hypothetical protein
MTGLVFKKGTISRHAILPYQENVRYFGESFNWKKIPQVVYEV